MVRVVFGSEPPGEPRRRVTHHDPLRRLKVAIVGAGIAGPTLAYRLLRYFGGLPHVENVGVRIAARNASRTGANMMSSSRATAPTAIPKRNAVPVDHVM